MFSSIDICFIHDSLGTGKETDQEKLLANERQNFKLLYEKVNELGGVPMMVRSADMSNTIPDEKVVITYVSYLCARLLDLRQETRAARTIQLAWRAHHLRKEQNMRLVSFFSLFLKLKGPSTVEGCHGCHAEGLYSGGCYFT